MVRARDRRTTRQQAGDFLHKRRWWIGAVATTVLAATVWALWPTTPPDPPRARQYLAFTACLLTGERGVTNNASTPVWAGLQDASLATRAKVQYLAVTGPQTIDNAVTFVGTLAMTHCDLVFAADPVPVAAVTRAAPTFPSTRFFAVGADAAQTNLTPVTAESTEKTRAAVNRIVTTAVGTPPPP